MNKEIQLRLQWILLYEKSKNAGLTYRWCGISIPTLRKWFKRYHDFGTNGLKEQSRNPINYPIKKVEEKIVNLIEELRLIRNLEACGIDLAHESWTVAV